MDILWYNIREFKGDKLKDKIEKLFRLNQKYEENDFNGVYQGISNFRVFEGFIPLLFSSAHAVKQVRNGVFKRSDGLTGGIVEYLVNNKDIYGITRVHNMLDDPNFYNYGISFLYKQKIIEMIQAYEIKCFFDIHGCSNKHGFDIEIGTNNGKNIQNEEILDIILKGFSKFKHIAIDEKFIASHGSNISHFVHEMTNIPCIQIELSEHVRFNETEQMLDSFEKIIDDIKRKKLVR